MLEFARTWGPPWAEPTLSQFQGWIRRTKKALSLAIVGDWSAFYAFVGRVAPASSRVSIEQGVVYRDCKTLADFCWLELLACIDRGVEFRRCHICGDVYAGKRTGLRSGAQAPKLCGKPACKRANEKVAKRVADASGAASNERAMPREFSTAEAASDR